MSRLARAVTAFALAATIAGCGDKVNGTLFVVRVGLEGLAPGADVDQIDVVATPAQGAAANQSFPIDGSTALPVRLALVPQGARDQAFAVTATGRKNGQPVVAVTANLAFQPDVARELLLVLSRGCSTLGSPPACASTQTCRRGSCVDPATFATEVVPFDRDAGAAGGTGGMPAGGAGGGSGPDAGRDASPSVDAAPKPPSGTWVAVDAKLPATVTLTSVWVNDANDVTVVGYDATGALGRAYHWNGRGFDAITVPLTTPPLNGVWSSSPEDVWAVGANGAFLHGSAAAGLSPVDAHVQTTLSGIIGFGKGGDVWAVGTKGTIVHALGPDVGPVQTMLGQVDLVGVSGVRALDLWAVGAGGGVFRGNARDWARVDQGLTMNVLYAVWVVATDDVWITGERAALHWNGQRVSASQLTLAAGLSVWGRASYDVWAVGRPTMNGTPISRFDGTTWTAVPAPFTGTLQSVRGAGAADVWAVGNMGTVLRFVPDK